MPNVHVTDAQPLFSDEEMAALFRALGVAGDVHNSEDCENAMSALNAALTDPEREQAVSDVLAGIAAHANAEGSSRLVMDGNVTPVRVTSSHGEASEFDDDEPSTGRVLNWKAEKLRTVDKRAEIVEYLLPSGGSTSTTGLDARWRPRWKEERETNYASLESFIVRASESLEVRQFSFTKLLSFLRIDEWFTRNEVKWRAADDGVDVAVRHGERTWDVKVMLSTETVLLLVTKDRKTVVEREVERSRPDVFSKTLLFALGGDMGSTYLTLDAVHEAASLERDALH